MSGPRDPQRSRAEDAGKDGSGGDGSGDHGAPAPGAGERGPGDPEGVPVEEQIFFCDLCGHPMLNLHCKLICEQCGYKRDCSDP